MCLKSLGPQLSNKLYIKQLFEIPKIPLGIEIFGLLNSFDPLNQLVSQVHNIIQDNKPSNPQLAEINSIVTKVRFINY